MEDVRPPAMKEVKHQQAKTRALIIIISIAVVLALSVRGYFGFKNLTIYMNYLSVEKKYQLLGNYYKALVAKDEVLLAEITPTSITNTYNFVEHGGNYALYIYPDENSDEQQLFHLVDHSVIPSISYLQEVQYGKSEETGDLVIEYIGLLGQGQQID